MDTPNESKREPKGKTIIKKYSRWNKGQHKSSVMQTVPGHKTQFIGKIYFEKQGENKSYVGKSADDREVFTVAEREYEVEKWFQQEGPRLAMEKIEAEKAKNIPQEQESAQQPEPPAPPTPDQELADIRSRRGVVKDQSIAR